MKKSVLTLLPLMCALISVHADIYSHTFKFDPTKFSISTGAGDSIRIRSIGAPSSHPDPSQPDLPIISRSIAIPGDSYIDNYSFTFYKHKIRDCVNVENSTLPIPTNMRWSSSMQLNKGYPARVYPDSICVLATNNQLGDVRVAGFLISPFLYDAEARTLYFIDSISINLQLGYLRMPKIKQRMHTSQIDILRSIVDNVEFLESLPVNHTNYPNVNQYDYLLITSKYLKQAFLPLVNWKCKKGVPSKIITTEEIEAKYTDGTLPMKIKRCIFDERDSCGVLFVLLGADVPDIPTMPCYVKTNVHNGPSEDNVNTYKCEDIPADIYYACRDNYDWDTNGDGLIGNFINDRINLLPEIHITRAPVRSIEQAGIFVDRIIKYEQSPNTQFDFLQSGTILNDSCKGETLANLLYNEVINRKIYLGRNKFFDTCTYNDISFTPQNFKFELEKGYQFVEIISHGTSKAWTDGSKTIFRTTEASTLNNQHHTLVTTMACETNAFDSIYSFTDPLCLSEALLLNKNSGVIGYLGSSRLGWFHNNSLDYSMAYETDFYHRLLDNDVQPHIKYFGAIITFMKLAMHPLTTNNSVQTWLYYSINALGDPETPIFNRTPREFINARIESDLGAEFTVYTGFSDTRICVSNSLQNPVQHYEITEGDGIRFCPLPGEYDVWIWRPGYIPKFFSAVVNPLPHPQSSELKTPNLISVVPNPSYSSTLVKYEVGSMSSKIIIEFTNTDGTKVINFSLEPDKYEDVLDLSSLPKGIYIVTLYVDDKPIVGNSLRILKQ